jgi:hypothetical protein
MALRWSSRSLAILACCTLCIVFAAVSWKAVSRESATWDEPGHAATGWLMLWHHDFRISPDVPPLWEYWVALPTSPQALLFDPDSPHYVNLHTKGDLFAWIVNVLYHTPGNDPIDLVNRGRFMCLILAVALAILIARWGWAIGGPIAAVAATFLYCLDPNFLAHGPLVKNDVAFSLLYFAAAYAMWRVGRKLTLWNTAFMLALTAAAFSVKLSGILLAPVLVIGLFSRAFMHDPWIMIGRPVTARRAKLAVAFALCVAAIIVTYAGLWASYGFRFDAGPNGMRSDTTYYLDMLHVIQVDAQTGQRPTPDQLAAWKMPFSTRVVLYLEDRHLLPQAWTAGFVLTQTGDVARAAYLMGVKYNGGRWFYFPLAALFKTPLATLIAVALALIVAVAARRQGVLRDASNRWTVIALALPMLVYGAALVSAHLNIGLRHALPMYPFVYVAVALAIKWAWQKGAPAAMQSSPGRIVILALAALLAAETAAAFPNYLPFFNLVFASHRMDLLSDSNLDWGQDLPALAAWQHEHADIPLYLEYFGLCDPAAYGIQYVNVPGGYVFGPTPAWPTKPGYVVISATDMQLLYSQDSKHDLAVYFQNRKPEMILGDTLYLFTFTPTTPITTWAHPSASDRIGKSKTRLTAGR